MAIPETRQELINWCLRRLGSPVLEINLDEDQIEDRIDEAILYFRDYHFDGVERCYLHHQITASTMILTSPYLTDVKQNYVLIGQTSGVEAWLYDISDDKTSIRFKIKSRKDSNDFFQPGENVLIEETGDFVTLTASPSDLIEGDVDRQYINISPSNSPKVIGVTNVLPPQGSSIGAGSMGGGMFSFQYQFALHNVFNLASADPVTYDIYKRYISMWEFMFRGIKGIRFNRKTDKLYIDIQDWIIDRWIVIEAWVALDPEMYKTVYSDEFLREYAYNLLKRQWGTNLKKFSGIQLPGNVTLNGKEMYDEAEEALTQLRERLRKEFELPPDMLVG